MYQAIYSFSISDFLEAFPACQKLVLRHAPFRGIDQKSNIVTNTTGSPVAPKHLLRELRLPPTSEMDIPSMVKVLESQNQLRSIEFGGHRHQQRIEDIFEALPVFCPHLTSFVMLIATSSMPNALWINLFNSYPNLWRFHVGGSIMDDSVVRLLPQCCKGLKDLSISHCPNVTFQSVRDILTSCSRLVCLNVGGVELSSEVFTGSVEWACKATLRDLSLRCLQARRADHEQIRYRLEQLVELERLTMCGRHMHMDMMLPPLENMLKDLQGEDQQDVKQEQQEQQEQEQQEQQEQEQEQYPYLHECLAPPQPLYPRLKMLRFQEFETLMNVEQTQRFFAEVPEIEAAYMTRCFDSNAITWLSQYRRDLGFGSVRRF
ncbi:hypothetical protein BGZ58_009033 [Dissophora ornata]|nr:hypothetical protein BGZ58_009033 [Dissophora ornata]